MYVSVPTKPLAEVVPVPPPPKGSQIGSSPPTGMSPPPVGVGLVEIVGPVSVGGLP
jgi:hypothetical protein